MSEATHSPEAPPETLFVLRFSSAGDILLTAAAIEAVAKHWPSTRIVYVTKLAFVDLARCLPHVDDVLALAPGEGGRSLRRRMAAAGPCAVLDLHGKLRSWLVRGVAPRSRRAVWLKRELVQSLAVNVLGRPYRAQMHIALRYHRAAESLVGCELPRGRMRYVPSPAHVEEAQTLLRKRGVAGDALLIGMSPGAMWETKRWPAERFAQLGARMAAAGYVVVVTGSSAEQTIAGQVADRIAGSINLAGELSLGGLGGLVQGCRAFVANDSGPMHLARALGIPTLTFFGSTDPGQFDFSGHALQFVGTPCAPCSFHGLRRCPKGHLRCLQDITVDAAHGALMRLLAGPRFAPCVAG